MHLGSVRHLHAVGRPGGVRGAPTLAGTCDSGRGEPRRQRELHRHSRPMPLRQPEPLRRQSSTGRTPVSGGRHAQPRGEAVYASRSSVCPPRGASLALEWSLPSGSFPKARCSLTRAVPIGAGGEGAERHLQQHPAAAGRPPDPHRLVGRVEGAHASPSLLLMTWSVASFTASSTVCSRMTPNHVN